MGKLQCCCHQYQESALMSDGFDTKSANALKNPSGERKPTEI
ncbi:hypothetical protein [Nostoc sp. UHCC 0252]|nr:hypothetical protein [Nostoc sp. UHCC 0252]MEA5602242.1 hypothetical protein [Nostoc sp. UHCC 0252]